MEASPATDRMQDTVSYRIFTDYPGVTPEGLHVLISQIVTYTQSNLMAVDGIDHHVRGTVGIHRQTGREHIHLHCQVHTPLWKDHGKKNASHMKAWFRTNDLQIPGGQDLTMTTGFAKDVTSVDDHLSYPFKEGLVYDHPLNPPNPRLEFLLQRGQGIFAAEQRARQQKLARETKSKNIVSQLNALLTEEMEGWTQATSSVEHLKNTVIRRFMDQFNDPLDMPNMNDVKNAWQKVSVFKRVVYSAYYI